MFWRLGITRSSIDEVLERDNVTLKDILNEEEVVQECKNRNEKLLDFLGTSERLQELLEFALEDSWRAEESDSALSADRDLGAVAAEILSSDVEALENSIVNDEQLLSKLFRVLDATEPLDDGLSSRFTNIASHLYNRKGKDVMSFVQSSGDTLVNGIINHIGDEGMDDLLLRLMGIEVKDENAFNNFPFAQFKMRDSGGDPDSKPDAIEVGKWWNERNILTSLIEKFDAEQSTHVYTNVSKILTEIAKRQPDVSPLAESIRSTELIKQLLEKVLDNSQSDILQHVIPILSTIITTSVTVDTQAGEAAPEGIQTIIDRIPQFVGLLDTTPEQSFTTPAGELNPPLGPTRLKLVEFFGLLFQLSFEGVQEALISSGVMSKLLDLMFQYENNNLLHNIVTDIICIIINSDSEELKKHLFEESNLLQILLKAEKENRKFMQESKPQRKPYMGHIIVISNAIVEASKNQSYIENLLKQDETWEKWVSAGLKERNRAETSVLGGPTPLSMGYNAEFDDYDEDDEEDDEVEIEQEERVVVEDDDMDNTLVVKMDVEGQNNATQAQQDTQQSEKTEENQEEEEEEKEASQQENEKEDEQKTEEKEEEKTEEKEEDQRKDGEESSSNENENKGKETDMSVEGEGKDTEMPDADHEKHSTEESEKNQEASNETGDSDV